MEDREEELASKLAKKFKRDEEDVQQMQAHSRYITKEGVDPYLEKMKKLVLEQSEQQRVARQAELVASGKYTHILSVFVALF